MQGKTIYAETDEVRLVTNNWTAEAEKRGTSVASSAWEVSGDLSLGAQALSGSIATALITVGGSGECENTATLANGEVLAIVRKVEV